MGEPRARQVVVCATTAQRRARFADALRGAGAVLHFVESLDELERVIRGKMDDVDAVILPTRDKSDVAAEPLVREIVAQRSKVAIVAYCDDDTPYAADIRALAVAGVHQIVVRSVNDDGGAQLEILAAARRQCAAAWLMRQLGGVVPPSLHPVVEAALSRPNTTSVGSLATALGVHRKTLFNRCESADCPPPAELLAWCRLALVAYHLEDGRLTIDAIGLELGYPSDTALRNTVKRYIGLRASELRQRGGVGAVVDALKRRLREWRTLRTIAPSVTLSRRTEQ